MNQEVRVVKIKHGNKEVQDINDFAILWATIKEVEFK